MIILLLKYTITGISNLSLSLGYKPTLGKAPPPPHLIRRPTSCNGCYFSGMRVCVGGGGGGQNPAFSLFCTSR